MAIALQAQTDTIHYTRALGNKRQMFWAHLYSELSSVMLLDAQKLISRESALLSAMAAIADYDVTNFPAGYQRYDATCQHCDVTPAQF